MSQTVGYTLVNALLSATKEQFAALSVEVDWLREHEQECFLYVYNHFRKYGKAPDIKTIQEEFPEWATVQTKEPPQYYADKVRERFVFEGLQQGMVKAKGLLNKAKGDFDPDAALKVLSETVGGLRFIDQKNDVADFRNAFDPLHAEYVKKQKGYLDSGVLLGWPTLDEMSGGISGGDVVSILGRPGMGKTWMELYSAHHVWADQQHVPMLVSMEMTPLPIQQRLAAMHSKSNPTHLKNAALSTVAKNKLFTGLQGMKQYERPFWIVNGNLAATVDDVFNLAVQLQPTVIYIDGAYLLAAEDRRLSGWAKITETANGIKQMLATHLNVPVICTYQFNREAAKKLKKRPEDIGLEDIAGADAVGQNSSIVLGLLQEENVESMTKKYVSIMKGRSGECGGFWINWNFHKTDISEFTAEQEAKALDYLG